MTIEVKIYNVLKALAGGRVFPDVAPTSAVRPYITYSQIGGEALAYLERAVPSKQNGRFQVDVWGDSRLSCASTMLQVEQALVESQDFQAKPVSAPSSSYDHDMAVYGSNQDFSIWSDR